MSKINEFNAEVINNVNSAGMDKELLEETHIWLTKALKHNYTHNFKWLGRPVIQIPQDTCAVQELVWDVKPDLIIETGIAHGGSLILSASMLALLDYCDAIEQGKTLDPMASNRLVVGIDIDIRLHNREAIEEHPMNHLIKMVDAGLLRFNLDVKAGRLILLNKAISESSEKVDFFVHATKTEWSSCLLSMAESDGSSSARVTVDSTNLKDLFYGYGVPYYLKVDVEGCDQFVAKQLSECEIKPTFVSFETSRKNYVGIFSYLFVAGYSRFQLINQANNPNRAKPAIVREGKDTDYSFSEFSSGYFGNDLPDDKWLSLDELFTQYVMYKELKRIDNVELGLGWVDVHAKLV